MMIESLRAWRTGWLLVCFASVASVTGAARSVPTFGAPDGGPSVLLSNADGRNPYSGIVRYVGRAQCTGVFVATVSDDEDPGDAPAYVLTNGHCPEFPGSNEVIVNRTAPASHRVVFNYFADTATRQFQVPVVRIAYATMKGQDLAVLELAARYDDIVRSGFDPWPVTLALPAPGEPLVIVGAPLTGVADLSFLRLASCRLESRAEVVLEYIWHWFDYFRNRCLDISGGSSGSPVISRRTGGLVGLVNTTTIGATAYSECFLNHPCEAVRGGVASQPNTSYMTPLIRINRCFDERGRFDVVRAGCPLDPGLHVDVTPAFLGAENPRRDQGLLTPPRRRWNVTVGGRFDYFRYKVVDAATGECRDLRGYGPSRRVSDNPVIDEPLPQAEGYKFLCVIGGTMTRGGERWQSVDHAAIVAVRIDTTPPRIAPPITVRELDISWVVEFRTIDPEISSYVYKFGRPGETRCDDPADYRRALIPFISLSKANRPYIFCAIPYDSALNQGRAFEALLQ